MVVTITVVGRSFSYWQTPRHRWRTAPGCYAIMVGDPASLPLHGKLARGGRRASCVARRRHYAILAGPGSCTLFERVACG